MSAANGLCCQDEVKRLILYVENLKLQRQQKQQEKKREKLDDL